MEKMSLADYAGRNEVEKIKNLLDAGNDVNEIDYDKSALHSACVSNAINAAELLISRGINVNVHDNISGASPLHYCAVYNNFEIARLILENGGEVNVVDKYGNEPLWTAIFNVKTNLQKLPIVELLLQHGGNKNHKNAAGRSPLDFADQVKFAPILDILAKY